MTEISNLKASRRTFLKGGGTAVTGLMVGFHLTGRGAQAAHHGKTFEANAFVQIGKDNNVTVIAKHIEFGQGSHSGLATILADELDADWGQVTIEAAPADATRYNNLHWGPTQGTGGSTAIANSWMQLREAGAKARHMLVQAAAVEWNVPASEIQVSKGVVSHGSKKASFGDLAEQASLIPVPEKVALKTPDQFTLIGGDSKRKDIPGKTDGTAVFTLDIKRPGMLYAVMQRPPRFGGMVKSFDASEAEKVKGVVGAVATPLGVAVLAKNTWAAIKGREALSVEWDDSKAETRSSATIMEEYHRLADSQPGLPARKDGDAESALKGAKQVLEASFDFPFLAHAPMEPPDAIIEMTADGGAEIWTGSQIPTGDQAWAAGILGLKPEQVKVNTVLAGGSFGRRATPDSDMVSEAAMVLKAIEGRAPVKMIWTREDDIQGGKYRPAYHHRLKAGLDEDGNIVGWQHKIVGQSILKGTAFEAFLVKDGIDATSVEGAHNLPYAIADQDVNLVTSDVSVPVLWWRSVGSTHTAYSTETFLDELAVASGKDPVEMRRTLLKGHERHLAALNLVAEKANWTGPEANGVYRGIAVHESFNSVVAQVADVSLRDDGSIKVEKIWCAVDCGTVVNPDVVVAQMEGGIGFGLGAILRNQVTLEEGVVDQSNFHDYEPLRISDMPDVEVHIVPSGAAPTGVGEPGTPPVGPAVANAVYAATGKRIRKLPFSEGLAGSV